MFDANPQYYGLDPQDAGAQPGGQPGDPSTDPNLSGPVMGSPAQGLPALLSLIAHLTGKQPNTLSPAMSALSNIGNAPAPLVPRSAPPLMHDPGMSGSPSLSPLSPPSQPSAASQPSGQPSAPSGPAPLTMPQMPHHNDTLLKIFSALSALSGGPGGRMGAAYQQERNAGDTQKYNQQVQAYQQQQRDTQQNFENQGSQAQGGSMFVQRLAKLDAASQEQTVRGMTPAMMAAYGYTPGQVQQQFFDAQGKFVPVSEDDSKSAPALARAQASARNTLYRLSTGGQQSYHDSFSSTPDDWVSQTGLPYAGFSPSATARDTNAAGTLAERINNDQVTGTAKISNAQNNSLKSLTAQTLPMQTATYQSYASNPQGFQDKYGVPYTGYKPGMTQSNATALLGVNNRETDAQRSNGTKISLDKLNIAARSQIDSNDNQTKMALGQLRNQLGLSQINSRVELFNQRYGAGSGNQMEKQYQSWIKEDMSVQKRMSVLSAPGVDPITRSPTLSQRDQGRIDENGNIVASPAPTAAYNEYMQLQQYHQMLQQKMSDAVPPASAMFGGGGPMRPAPVAVNGNTVLPNGSPNRGPAAPPLPFIGPDRTNGSGYSTTYAPKAQAPKSGPLGFSVGGKLQFMVPQTRDQFLKLTPGQRLQYAHYINQQHAAK